MHYIDTHCTVLLCFSHQRPERVKIWRAQLSTLLSILHYNTRTHSHTRTSELKGSRIRPNAQIRFLFKELREQKCYNRREQSRAHSGKSLIGGREYRAHQSISPISSGAYRKKEFFVNQFISLSSRSASSSAPSLPHPSSDGEVMCS